MNELYDSIRKYYYHASINYYKEFPCNEPLRGKVSFLWSLAALWQADNEMETVDNKKDLLKKDWRVIDKYFDTASPAAAYASYPPEFGKGDRFYDDNEWLGITAMEAYFRTKNKLYSDVGKNMYKFIMTGCDTVCGGGIYWKETGKSSKNTCSNGPAILLSLQLYKATNDTNYFHTALRLYHWTNKFLQDKDGLYFDNINVKTGAVDKRKFSYNTGAMLQANIYLYRFTKNKKYLSEANRIAASAKNYFYNNTAFKDNYWFNAVMLRAYRQLLEINSDKEYIDAFKKHIDYALQTNRNTSGLLGKQNSLNLVEQAGMLEMLARIAEIK